MTKLGSSKPLQDILENYYKTPDRFVEEFGKQRSELAYELLKLGIDFGLVLLFLRSPSLGDASSLDLLARRLPYIVGAKSVFLEALRARFSKEEERKGVLWAVPTMEIRVDKKFPVIAHPHITLVYGTKMSHWLPYIGRTFMVSFNGHSYNDHIEALTVGSLPDLTPFELDVPHLTLSHSALAKPYDAARMLSDKSSKRTDREIKPAILARMRIEFNEFCF